MMTDSRKNTGNAGVMDQTHRLHHGDCLDVLPKLEAESVSAIITDLPYGTTACAWDAIIPFEQMWKQVGRILLPDGVFVTTASQPFSSALVMSNLDWFRHEWIWIKNRGSNFANTVREPMKEHEAVLVFSPGGWTYNMQMQPRTGAGLERVKYDFNFRTKSDNYNGFNGKSNQSLPDLRVPSSWQKFNTEVGLHPTQKPTGLFEYLVKTYTNEGDVVLDCAMGSGTTGVACMNLGRRFLGIEIDREYFDTARGRIEKASNAPRQLELI